MENRPEGEFTRLEKVFYAVIVVAAAYFFIRVIAVLAGR